jgi:cytoskeletal protein RodZ
MKNTKLVLLAAAALGFALSLGACEQKKSDETPPSSVGTSQAPSPEKSTPDQSSTSPSSGSDAGSTGSAQGQKPEDSSKPQKG